MGTRRPRKKLNLTLTNEERIENAESKAIHETALKLWRRGRKPEGTIDDAGTWVPSDREHGTWNGPTKKESVRSYKRWGHVYRLVNGACLGLYEVPPDVTAFVAAEYPRAHVRTAETAVAENMKAADIRHQLDAKQKKVEARLAHEISLDGRLEARQKQLEGLVKRRKKLESKLKALDTRASKVKRSIAALERQKAKAAA